MATNDLEQINRLFDGLIQKLTPSARRQLARDIARSLRSSQAKRIKQNNAPDGTPYEPRKPQTQQRKGAIKRRLMFQKIVRARWLKANASSDHAAVSFAGFSAQVAREHHYGLRSRLSKYQNVQMPKRELLGITEKEQHAIEEIVIKYLAL